MKASGQKATFEPPTMTRIPFAQWKEDDILIHWVEGEHPGLSVSLDSGSAEKP